jgi:uncharacterized membrane protein HdeD (DUF308 family)
MTVVSIILGVLLVICGFLVIFTPILSFFGLGTVVAVALMIWGIMALVKCVRIRIYGFRCAMAILAIIIAFLLPKLTVSVDNYSCLLIAYELKAINTTNSTTKVIWMSAIPVVKQLLFPTVPFMV